MRGPAAFFVIFVTCLGACDSGGGDGDPGDGDGAPGADAGPPDAAPDFTADFVFDEGQVRTFALTIAQADWDHLNATAQDEQYVPADLVFEGRTYARIGVRYKGGFGTLGLCFDQMGNRVCPKLSMKLKFDEYVPNQRLAGLKRLNFHAMMYDPTAMKDRLGYALYRAAGVPAPRAASALITVNGEPLGLFALVEAIDGRFTADRFGGIDGGDGNLYKEIWPVYPGPEPYRAALETNEGPTTDVSRMVRFHEALVAAGDAGFHATISAWTDLPTLARFLAVDRLIENWDGIVGWYCGQGGCINHNYFWYEESGSDRMWLLPWDMDNTFQSPNPIRENYGMPDWDEVPMSCATIPVFLGIPGRAPACDDLVRRMATLLVGEYEAATAEVLAGPAGPGVLEAKIDAMAEQLAPHVAADAFGPTVAEWQAAVAELKAEIQTLRLRVTP